MSGVGAAPPQATNMTLNGMTRATFFTACLSPFLPSGAKNKVSSLGDLSLVGKGGFEPPRISPRDPKSRSSANSDTPPIPVLMSGLKGDPPRTRTWNLLIKSQLLCQLELAGLNFDV